MTATGFLQGHPHFIHWGVIQISLANLLVIVIMLAIFVLALILPFPHGRNDDTPTQADLTPQGPAHD